MRNKIAADYIKLKRAYAPAEEEEGQRILVDRLWPRGLSKADSKIDEWIKDIAPSTTLRKWFGHEVARWEAFHDRYIEEVSESTEPLERLREMARKGRITLVYAAHDTEHNNAVVLRERSEEHTSELQSLMRISYAVFCLKKKNKTHKYTLT